MNGRRTILGLVFSLPVPLADVALLTIAYGGAFLVRMQFAAPFFGWKTAAASTASAILVQMAFLSAARLNVSYRWRVRGGEIPRYAGAFLCSAGILLALRGLLSSVELAWARPPYSVTIVDMVFAFAAVTGFRFLRERWWLDRLDVARTLLGDRVHPEIAAAADWVRGKCILVTGAGGSIGSEIVRQVARAGARRVLMVDRGENALYQIDLEMRTADFGTVCVPLMIDINDGAKMDALFEAARPDAVFHAAAYKHVPMCEANPEEARRNNFLATRDLAKRARRFGTAKLVFISTDKAVNPKSVMGVTKRDAEREVLAEGYRVVRFGNVFGSSGSVVELWQRQIARGGPVTVTDRRMTRFFMSVEEAVGLVIAAGRLEPGFVYVLDMGRPVGILDLAKRMIRASGYRPYRDIEIVFTGVRAGEKLEEELGIEGAGVVRTPFAKIYRVADAAATRASAAS